jgi:hypothetical protein
VKVQRRHGGVLVATALLLAACGVPAPTAPTATTPSSASVAPTTMAATPLATPVMQSAGSGSPQSSASVAEDPSLLGILPASVAGVAVNQEHQAFTDATADPAFADSIEAAAFAVAVDGGDLASGLVARPRAGRYSDAWFRDWRETYDQGACGQAGGVGRRAEALLGGRTVYITSCTGGLRVYHAYVEQRGLVVSLFSLGERRFGEQLMAGLRP